jgi:hypothetical protein
VRAGVEVTLAQHSLAHGTPDAVFPNNWFSTHGEHEAGGATGRRTLVLYPMKCPNRAAERRPELRELLTSNGGYDAVVDMSSKEKDDVHFEGTGVLVLDRPRGTAFVSLSDRADNNAAEEWVDKLGYKNLVTFTSVGDDGFPVYHTNVMMAVGTGVAIVCGASVPDDRERQHLLVRRLLCSCVPRCLVLRISARGALCPVATAACFAARACTQTCTLCNLLQSQRLPCHGSSFMKQRVTFDTKFFGERARRRSARRTRW